MKFYKSLFILLFGLSIQAQVVINSVGDAGSIAVEDFIYSMSLGQEEMKKHISPAALEVLKSNSKAKLDYYSGKYYWVIVNGSGNNYYDAYQQSNSNKKWFRKVFKVVTDAQGNYYVDDIDKSLSVYGNVMVWDESEPISYENKAFKKEVYNYGRKLPEMQNIIKEKRIYRPSLNQNGVLDTKEETNTVNTVVASNSVAATEQKDKASVAPTGNIDRVKNNESAILAAYLNAMPDIAMAEQYIHPDYEKNLFKASGNAVFSKGYYKPEVIDFEQYVIVDYKAMNKRLSVALKIGDNRWVTQFVRVVPSSKGLRIMPNDSPKSGKTYHIWASKEPSAAYYTDAEFEEAYSTVMASDITPQKELVDGFSAIMVELLKKEKFKLKNETQGVVKPDSPLTKQAIKQKQNYGYLFFLITHEDNPVLPIVRFDLEAQTEPVIMDNFFEIYDWDHPAVPKDIRIYRVVLPAQVDKAYNITISNSNDFGYGKFLLFERKF